MEALGVLECDLPLEPLPLPLPLLMLDIGTLPTWPNNSLESVSVFTIDSTDLAIARNSVQVLVGSPLSIRYSLTLESVLCITNRNLVNIRFLKASFLTKLLEPSHELSLVLALTGVYFPKLVPAIHNGLHWLKVAFKCF